MDKRIKKIDIDYKRKYIIINDKYYIALNSGFKTATVYNMIDKKNIPSYIFRFIELNNIK